MPQRRGQNATKAVQGSKEAESDTEVGAMSSTPNTVRSRIATRTPTSNLSAQAPIGRFLTKETERNRNQKNGRNRTKTRQTCENR